MQTFLPHPDFAASARVLDQRRLGKQRVETFQILRALTWQRYGWKNHPATKMWRGFVPALVAYGLAMAAEWTARGHADATRAALLDFTGGREPVPAELAAAGQLPPWLGLEALHLSHRSALVRKDPEHYRAIFGDVPDDLPYVWPAPSFPRWPLLRGTDQALDVDGAAELLGVAVPPDAHDVVRRLLAGENVQVRDDGEPAATLALLAGLATPGRTAWINLDAPSLPAPVPDAALPPLAVSTAAGRGAVSASIARPPEPEDAELVAQLAEAEPEFAFWRPGQSVDGDGWGLVVVRGSGATGSKAGRAGHGAVDVDRVGADAAGGAPVLTLLSG